MYFALASPSAQKLKNFHMTSSASFIVLGNKKASAAKQRMTRNKESCLINLLESRRGAALKFIYSREPAEMCRRLLSRPVLLHTSEENKNTVYAVHKHTHMPTKTSTHAASAFLCNKELLLRCFWSGRVPRGGEKWKVSFFWHQSRGCVNFDGNFPNS